MKVAIIIPTMNRPDFLLRQFRFYQMVKSPHPIYISDSSNEENAKKIQEGIGRFKDLRVTYQWAPPGKDNLHQILPMVKEKYCIQMGDDDLIIPATISECADFLEANPDYATCAGKQVNFRFRREDYIKPYGSINHQTLPLGNSIEDEDLLLRVKNFWTKPNFICFTVRKTDTERFIRNITKQFSLLEHLMEFFLWSALIISGKAKVIDRLGYVMQISDNRYNFIKDLTLDYLLMPDFAEKWKFIGEALTGLVISKTGKDKEESDKISKWILILYLSKQFNFESGWISVEGNNLKKIRLFRPSLLRKIYHKINPPSDVTSSNSKYFADFVIVKKFLESTP